MDTTKLVKLADEWEAWSFPRAVRTAAALREAADWIDQQVKANNKAKELFERNRLVLG